MGCLGQESLSRGLAVLVNMVNAVARKDCHCCLEHMLEYNSQGGFWRSFKVHHYFSSIGTLACFQQI